MATTDTKRPAGPPGRTRLVVGWSAVVVTFPYLLLKAAWILGSTVGMADPHALDGPVYQAANIATVFLDLTAIGVALALTFPWGQRLPAALVLLPAWCAAGLLGTVLVQSAVTAPFVVTRPADANDGLHGWVYALVYTTFSLQGLLLGAAFVLYCAARWPGATRSVGPLPPTTTGPVLVGCCVLLAAAYLYWTVGGTAGLDGPFAATAVARAGYATHAGFCLLTGIGLFLLRSGRGVPTSPLPLALLWVGSASMLTWGVYLVAIAAWNPSGTTPAVVTVTVAKSVLGAAVGVVLARLLRTRSRSLRRGR